MNNNEYNWVYILKCHNGSYYTGYTADLVRRYREHQTGTGKAKYTRSFKPEGIAACWKVSGQKGNSLRVEHFIKKKGRSYKEAIIARPETLIESLREYFPEELELMAVDPFAIESMNDEGE